MPTLIQQRSAARFTGQSDAEIEPVDNPSPGRSAGRPAILLLLLCAGMVVVWLLASASWGADSHNILAGARALLHRLPPTSTNLLIYPSTVYVIYMPLGLLPAGMVQPLTQAACLVAVGVSLRLWASAEGGRAPMWIWAVLLSAPALQLIYIDQFNTAMALLSVSAVIPLMDRGRLGWLGALSAFALIAKPFCALPLLPGLACLRHRRGRVIGIIAATIGCLGVVTLLAWAWDPSSLAHIFSALARRPLVGIPGLSRDLFGSPGVVGLLAVWAGFEMLVARRLAGHGSPTDVAAVLVALSVIPLHLGGPYVAVLTFPALARLAVRRDSPHLAIAYASLYSVATVLGSAIPKVLPAGSGVADGLTEVAILLPVISAVGLAYLLVRDLQAAAPVLSTERPRLTIVDAGGDHGDRRRWRDALPALAGSAQPLHIAVEAGGPGVAAVVLAAGAGFGDGGGGAVAGHDDGFLRQG